MERTDERYGHYVAILEEELIAAMGCTEPIAIALAAARARELLGACPSRVEVEASGSIIKNAKSVVVPHTGGLKGIEAAVAAGIVAGRADRGLEVIAEVSQADVAQVVAYLERTPIEVGRAKSELDFDIVVRAFAKRDAQMAGPDASARSALVRIADHHTNIVREERDGIVLRDVAPASEGGADESLTDRSVLSMEGIWDFATTVRIEDVRALLDRQIACNDAIAREGLDGVWGANVGSVMLGAYGGDVKVRACAHAAAASDARMSGCELPVVINSGSGNQGITVSVPLIVYARELGSSDEQLYRALVLSNLVAIHQKTGIGRLSAFCGAVSASCAVGAAITYMVGGDLEAIKRTIENTLANIPGIICDGAKISCAAKIAAGLDAAFLAHHLSMNGKAYAPYTGILRQSAEETISCVGLIGKEGMKETDREILQIMLQS